VKKFIISTDSCIDYYKSYLEQHNIYCISLTRVLNGVEVAEHYSSDEEFDAFYDTLKNGDRPTTVALNPYELKEYFKQILEKEKTGDIVHLSLSSGLSMTWENAQSAVDELNQELKDRQIHLVDSLSATIGMNHAIDKLMRLQDAGSTAQDAVKHIEELRTRQQGWVIMSDLMHLKRGGRISGIKATIGTVFNVKPIIVLTKKGKLVLENKMRGNAKAINYVLSKMKELGQDANEKFFDQTFYLARTSESPLFNELKTAIIHRYPNIKIKQSIVNPIIGTHLGCGIAAVLFEGARRLNINDKQRGS